MQGFHSLVLTEPLQYKSISIRQYLVEVATLAIVAVVTVVVVADTPLFIVMEKNKKNNVTI